MLLEPPEQAVGLKPAQRSIVGEVSLSQRGDNCCLMLEGGTLVVGTEVVGAE